MYTYAIIIYNFIRIAILKIRYGKRAKIKPIQRIAARSRIRLHENSQCKIDENIDVRPFCEFVAFGKACIEIGNHTFFNRFCMISCHCKVKIGSNCLFAPSVKIFDNNHKFDAQSGVKQELSSAPIEIGDNCWFGSNAVILKGAKIGNNCVIGAGCIVNSEVPDGSIIKMSSNNFTIEKIK